MNRLNTTFRELKKRKQTASVIYLTVGYPDIATTEKLVVALQKIGVDIFELGVPFSDPLADGPMIQEASTYALKKGVSIEKVLALTKRLRKKISSPLLMMGYFNPILRYGLERFAHDAQTAGLDGVIIPDLPLEEAHEFQHILSRINLSLIEFIAPTTDKKRMHSIAAKAKGFIYYVSLTGVTGARSQLPTDITQKLLQLKKITKVPVCVGFGVSTNEQFRYLSRSSDGVIIGSAVLKVIKENMRSPGLVKKVVHFVKNLIR